MTETSLLPLAASAASLDFADLCERLIALAVGAPVGV
jgi:D-alanine-D-alanine ligase-like ATP-grasp enzyme